MKKQLLKKIALYFMLCSTLTIAGAFAFPNEVSKCHRFVKYHVKKTVVHHLLDEINECLCNTATSVVSVAAVLGNVEDANLSANPAVQGIVSKAKKSIDKQLDKIGKKLNHLCFPKKTLDSFNYHAYAFMDASIAYIMALNASPEVSNLPKQLAEKDMIFHANALNETFRKISDSDKVVEIWTTIGSNIRLGAKSYREAHNLSQQDAAGAEEAGEAAVDACNKCTKLFNKYFNEIKRHSNFKYICEDHCSGESSSF